MIPFVSIHYHLLGQSDTLSLILSQVTNGVAPRLFEMTKAEFWSTRSFGSFWVTNCDMTFRCSFMVFDAPRNRYCFHRFAV